MKLLTKTIAAKLPPLGATERVKDPIVHVKFFDPCGSWTWYCTEGNPETGEMFGLVRGFETELGYFDLSELASVKNCLGLGIERDLHWRPVPLSRVQSGEVR